MMMSTKLPNEERPVDPQAQENIDRILHADAPKGSIGAATARAASHGGVGPHNILAVLNEMGHIRPTPEPKPTRAKPIRGVCVNCGKNWSRHYSVNDGDGAPHCHADPFSTRFSLERAAPEPPAPATGKLTKEDAERFRDLMETLTSRIHNEQNAAQVLFNAGQLREAAHAELDAFLADHTA